MFWNPTYMLFALPALLLAMWAQSRVRSAYAKFMRVPSRRGLSGAQAAQRLLQARGLAHVGVRDARGDLTDHYDPRSKTLHLSQGVSRSSSIAALSIVAHEVGHAVQDQTGYGPLKLRSGIVPMVQVSAAVGPIVFFLGARFTVPGILLTPQNRRKGRFPL